MTRPIKQTEQIETARLTLAPMAERDTDALVAILSNGEVTRFYMVPDYQTREEFVALARKLIDCSRVENTQYLVYGIYLAGHLIGFVNHCGADADTIEIGYALHPDHQGHGYATEAFAAVIGDIKRMGFIRVLAGYFEENPASFRVMQKCALVPNGEEEEIEYRGKKHRCIYCERKL